MSQLGKHGKSDGSIYNQRGSKVCVIGDQGRGIAKSVDQNSKILKKFKEYGAHLDECRDRFERIVKISRDVNIESKRIIFLLHSIDRAKERESALTEAETRLNHLVKECFFKIAKELQNEDPYLYYRAFTFGLQEFIEACTFYHYLKDKNLYHWDYYQRLLTYKNPEADSTNLTAETLENAENNNSSSELISTLPPVDFFYGVADLTGELMRRCVNNLGVGDIEGCFDTCSLVKKLYAGFLSFDSYRTKEMSQKVYTLKQSLLKMEKICYNIHIRSKEFPQYMLANLATEFEYPATDDY